jgi:hypothetical protein
MRPIGWGLAAALLVAVLAPVAVMSAPKAAAPAVSAEARKQGMAEAPPLVQAANLPCQVSDARFVGKSPEDKKKGTGAQSYYEVACGQNQMGYIVQSTAGATPTAFTCVEADTPQEAGKPASLPCILPGNADPKAALATALANAKVQCVPENARGIGQSKTNTFLEVACQGGAGYVIVASSPFDASKKLEAQNCLNFDATEGNIKCTLGDKAARLAVVDKYAADAKNGCTVKDRRFMGTATDGSNFYEASCQDGKGYIYKVATTGALDTTYECAKAQGILGGCTLTDARQAETQQAGLYTKLAKAAGSNCDVTKYAIFPAQAGEDVVEMVCADGKGGVGIFKSAGKSEVLDCGHALVAGYKCSLNKAGAGYDALTADLRKFDQKSCTVSNARLAAKTAKGTLLLEVACSDGYKGYMIEYSASPVTAVASTGCAFAGGCKLPGNT